MSSDIIIDDLACFLSSGKSDYSQDKLCDIAYSFYSHEEIKTSKEKIFAYIDKDLVWRRDPDKKMKDLNDLNEGLNELKDKNKHIKYVSDSYKKMPPVGLEFIAPILLDLSEEINKINNILPGIMDIKSTVINTADTVRNFKIDLNNLQKLLQLNNNNNNNNCNSDMTLNNPITPSRIQPNIENKLKSLRQNGVYDNNSSMNRKINNNETVDQNLNHSNPSSLAKPYIKVKTPCTSSNTQQQGLVAFTNGNKNITPNNKNINNGTNGEDNVGDISVTPTVSNNPTVPADDTLQLQAQLPTPATPSKDDDDGWTMVNRYKKNNKSRSSSAIITGVKNTPNNKFKSANRTYDLYVGRVDKNVVDSDIISYVENNFQISPIKIEQLEIKAANYAAFKLTINSNDRETLLNPEKWPCGIIINKFYRRNYN